MFAGWGVKAGFGQAQALHRFSPHDVGLDNLIDIGLGDMPVPDCVGIDDDVRAVFALIEAARLISAYLALQSAFCQLLLEEFLQPGLGGGIAAPPGMSRRTLVSANENMFFELRHQISNFNLTGQSHDTNTSSCF